MGKAVLAIIGIILFLAGLVYIAVPSLIETYNLGFGLEARNQLYLGAGLVILGLILLILKFKR